jgi:putative endonuclease
MAQNHDLGKQGEDLAFKHILSLGYKILERNWCFRKMEIDLIARDKNQLVFLEVKTRANDKFGKPFEFVSLNKQKLMVRGANFYLEQKNILAEARFDIISITLHPQLKLEHIQDAFYT